LEWILLAIVLGDPDRFKILGVGFFSDVEGEGRETVTIIIVVVSIGPIPSPCLNDVPRVAAVIDLLP
jgi:hypothetical protein